MKKMIHSKFLLLWLIVFGALSSATSGGVLRDWEIEAVDRAEVTHDGLRLLLKFLPDDISLNSWNYSTGGVFINSLFIEGQLSFLKTEFDSSQKRILIRGGVFKIIRLEDHYQFISLSIDPTTLYRDGENYFLSAQVDAERYEGREFLPQALVRRSIFDARIDLGPINRTLGILKQQLKVLKVPSEVLSSLTAENSKPISELIQRAKMNQAAQDLPLDPTQNQWMRRTSADTIELSSRSTEPKDLKSLVPEKIIEPAQSSLSSMAVREKPKNEFTESLLRTHRLLFSAEPANFQNLGQLRQIDIWVPKSVKISESEHDHTVLFNSDLAADIVVLEISEDGRAYKRQPSFFQLAGPDNHSSVTGTSSSIFSAMIDYSSSLLNAGLHLEFSRSLKSGALNRDSHLSVRASNTNLPEVPEFDGVTPVFASGSTSYRLDPSTFQTDGGFLVPKPFAVRSLRLSTPDNDSPTHAKKFVIEKYSFNQSYENDPWGSDLGATQLPWVLEKEFALNSGDARKISDAAHYFLRKYIGNLGYRVARKQRWSSKILFSGIASEGLTVAVTRVQSAENQSLYRFEARLHAKGREAVAQTYGEQFAKGMPSAIFIFDQNAELVDERGAPLLPGGLDAHCWLTLVRFSRSK